MHQNANSCRARAKIFSARMGLIKLAVVNTRTGQVIFNRSRTRAASFMNKRCGGGRDAAIFEVDLNQSDLMFFEAGASACGGAGEGRSLS